MAVIAFQALWIGEMFMTAIFILFSRNGKWFRKRKAEIAGKYGRKALTGEICCISEGKEKHRVPDTAHDCPILRIGVVHDQPVSERESLWEVEPFYSSTICSCTTKPPSSLFRFDNAEGEMLLDWCWFSSGEMTGKFRKVASHSAPEPAFGLFLNLPEGSAPWNPGTSIA